MEQGVVMMIWGSKQYGFAAHNMALSLRHYSPSVPITILTDSEAAKGLRDTTLFESVIHLAETPHDPALSKMQIYDKLPYDHNLYLDADGICLKNIEPLIETLKQGGDYRCHVYDWYTVNSPDLLPMMVWAHRSVIWNHYGFTSERMPATQSSLQYIRKSDFARDLFLKMQANYAQRIPLEKLRYKWGGGQPDELYLNITLAQLGYDPTIPETSMYWGDNHSLAFARMQEKYYFLSMFGTASNIKKPYVMGYDGTLANISPSHYKWKMIAMHKIANKGQDPQKRNDGLGRSAFAKRFFKEAPLDDRPIEGVVNLFVSYFKVDDYSRQWELDDCMRRNIANQDITRIYNLGAPFDDPKVVNLPYNRPTYQQFIDEANRAGGDYSIIANADIYFDKTLRWIDKIDMTGVMITLCRYDIKGGHPRLFAYAHSQDTWIFKGTINLTGQDFYQGQPGCDNRIAYDATAQGYRVHNPAKDIRTFHLHESGVRSYTQDDRVTGNYKPILITSVLDIGRKKKLLLKQPGKIGDILICLPIARWYSQHGYQVDWECPSEYHDMFRYISYAKPMAAKQGPYDKIIDIGFGINRQSPSNIIWQRRLKTKSVDSFVTLKYELSGVPLSERHNLHYTRNHEREQSLFNALGLSENEPYVLFHGQSDYGTPVNPPLTDLRVVEFKPVGDYTVFDWREVIEKASEIHCIDSCLANFVEVIEVPAKKIFYRVPQRTTESLYDFNNKWELICT